MEQKQIEQDVSKLLDDIARLKSTHGSDAWSRIEAACIMSSDLHQNNLDQLNKYVKMLAKLFGPPVDPHSGFTKVPGAVTFE